MLKAQTVLSLKSNGKMKHVHMTGTAKVACTSAILPQRGEWGAQGGIIILKDVGCENHTMVIPSAPLPPHAEEIFEDLGPENCKTVIPARLPPCKMIIPARPSPPSPAARRGMTFGGFRL